MKLIKFILTFLILFVFSQCKKEHRYPEDPDKSKKTPNERLEGMWVLEEYRQENNNILDSMNSICGCDLKFELTFTYAQSIDETKNDEKIWIFQIGVPHKFGFQSTKSFSDFHYLELGPDDGLGYATFNKLFVTPFRSEIGSIARWDVLKLFGDEFHVQLKTDTGTYLMKFSRLPE